MHYSCQSCGFPNILLQKSSSFEYNANIKKMCFQPFFSFFAEIRTFIVAKYELFVYYLSKKVYWRTAQNEDCCPDYRAI